MNKINKKTYKSIEDISKDFGKVVQDAFDAGYAVAFNRITSFLEECCEQLNDDWKGKEPIEILSILLETIEEVEKLENES